MAKRRRCLIAGDHPPMRLVHAIRRASEPIKLLEVEGLDKVNLATGVNSRNPSPISSSSVSIARHDRLRGRLLVGVFPRFM
jgi:hypothetical protein